MQLKMPQMMDAVQTGESFASLADRKGSIRIDLRQRAARRDRPSVQSRGDSEAAHAGPHGRGASGGPTRDRGGRAAGQGTREAGLPPDGLPGHSDEGERDGFCQTQVIRARHIGAADAREHRARGMRQTRARSSCFRFAGLPPFGRRGFDRFGGPSRLRTRRCQPCSPPAPRSGDRSSHHRCSRGSVWPC